jgi:hypothetical protein
MATLTSQQLKDSYQSLVTIGDSITSNPTSGRLENGKGTPLTAVGINTDAPGNKIGIKTAVNTNERAINLYSGTTVAGNYVSIGSQYSETNANVNSEIRFGGENTGGAPSYLAFATGTSTSSTERLRIKSSGDISFRDGSASEAFYWDASAGSLGLGNTSPNGRLNIKSLASGQYLLNLDYADNTDGGGFYESNSTDLTLFLKDSSGNTDVQIASNGDSYFNGGNVGIGTDSPVNIASGYTNLTINGSGASNRGGVLSVSQADTEVGRLIVFNQELALYNQTSNPLIFGTGGSEKMRIDSSGNVGIGTQTVLGSANRLHVKVDDSNTDFSLGAPYHLLIENDNTTTGSGAMLGLRADTADGGIALHYNGAQNSGYMTFHVDAGGGVNGERMRIDSSGNVGIGTDSPSSYWANADDLVVATSGNTGISVVSGTTSLGYLIFADSTAGGDNTRGGLGYDHSTNNMLFRVNNDTRMTIDSSGNVLVGKTSLSNGVAGIELNNTGQLVGVFASGTHILGRNTNDGSILTFEKDGTTVGQVGTIAGFLTLGSNNNVALTFTSSAIRPSNIDGSGRDNAIDLGQSGNRFQDLYLSGSVYLGGTTSANALDDYEEGTWSPVYISETGSFTTMTMDIQSATYTKVNQEQVES